MKKRYIVMLAMLLLTSICFSGCGDRKAGETSSDDKQTETSEEKQKKEKDTDKGKTVNLRFWCDPGETDMFREQIDQFINEHKNEADIQIECEAVGTSECKDVLLSDVNNGADVFCMPDDQLLTMVASGVLEEVTNADTIADANLEGAVEAASVDGKLFAYPLTADNGYFLYYNKNYFNKKDVETLDRILNICEKNNKKFIMDWSSGWYLYSFFGNTGLEFGMNEDGLTNFCNWNKKKGKITGLDVAKGMLAISKSPAFLNEADFGTAMEDGSVIAAVSGVFALNIMKDAFGSDYGACKLPTYTCAGKQVQMASFTGCRLVGVNAYSKHKAWAEKLAEYLTGEESQKFRFERAGRGPSNKNVAASDEVQKNPSILAVIEQSEFGDLQKVGQKYWTPATKFGNTIAAGNPDNIPLQDLLDELVTAVTE